MKAVMIVAFSLCLARTTSAEAPTAARGAKALPSVAVLIDKLDGCAANLLAVAAKLGPMLKKGALTTDESRLNFDALFKQSENCAKLIHEADAEVKRSDLPVRNDSHLPDRSPMAAHWMDSRNSQNNPMLADTTMRGNIAIDRANVASALSYLLKLKTSSLQPAERVPRAEKHLAVARRYLEESIESLEALKKARSAKTKREE